MSIYHLHIPRTSGGYIRNLIINNLNPKNAISGHYRKISSFDFKDADFISGHYGIEPIKFVEKTFTVIRDPNELTFSYIKYLSLVDNNSKFNEDFLKKYLYQDDLRNSVTNVMTQFLSSEVKIEEYNRNIQNHLYMANHSWCLKNNELSYKNALSIIQKNNIKIFIYNSENLYSNILNFINVNDNNILNNKINESFKENNNLFEKYFHVIKNANYEDNRLYEELI